MGEREEQKKQPTAIFDVVARVTEVGREGACSQIRLDVGRGQIITITGLSDTVAKQFAMNLFRPVTMSFEAHDE